MCGFGCSTHYITNESGCAWLNFHFVYFNPESEVIKRVVVAKKLKIGVFIGQLPKKNQLFDHILITVDIFEHKYSRVRYMDYPPSEYKSLIFK